MIKRSVCPFKSESKEVIDEVPVLLVDLVRILSRKRRNIRQLSTNWSDAVRSPLTWSVAERGWETGHWQAREARAEKTSLVGVNCSAHGFPHCACCVRTHEFVFLALSSLFAPQTIVQQTAMCPVALVAALLANIGGLREQIRNVRQRSYAFSWRQSSNVLTLVFLRQRRWIFFKRKNKM